MSYTTLEPKMKKKAKAEKIRVNIAFPERYYRMLEELAEEEGRSKAEVMRDALAFKSWLREVVDDGGRILVERKNGQIAEVVNVHS